MPCTQTLTALERHKGTGYLNFHSLSADVSYFIFCLQKKDLPAWCNLAYERQTFLLAPPLRDVSRGGTSATQRQKFHTDDVNQCLHNKFGSHGVPNANLFNFTFPLVDFGKVLCSSANELQQNLNASSREDYIPQILAVLLEIHRVYI